MDPKVVLTPAQTAALKAAGFPFDPKQTSLTSNQIQALVAAGVKYVPPVK